MLAFESYTPTRLIMDPEAEQQTGHWVLAYGGHHVLLHYGGGSVIRSGLLDRVRASLKASGLTWVELGGVVPNPREDLVYQGIELCRQENVNFVLAVGGGSVLDSAKAIAIGACYDGDFWDFYGRDRQPDRRLPLGTIITLPATGSEASNSSVIKNDRLDIKRGLRSDFNRPDFSLINPELTYTLSNWQIACGAADIISHVLERYFTRTTGVGLTDRLCEAVVRTVLDETPRALENPQQYDVQANLFWASSIAHIGWLGMGRQEDWSAHAMEHELSGHFDTAHGAGLAVLFPAWMQYLANKDETCIPRFAQFCERVLNVPMDFAQPIRTVHQGITALSQTFCRWGLPANLKELGIPHERLADLPALVKRRPDGSVGNFGPLNEADLAAIYQMAWDQNV